MYSTFNIDNTSWLTFNMFNMILQTLFGFIVIQGIKVNTECYYWWQQSCYNWYAGELEEKYDWLDDGIIWT
jgi:hypothetical protein